MGSREGLLEEGEVCWLREDISGTEKGYSSTWKDKAGSHFGATANWLGVSKTDMGK